MGIFWTMKYKNEKEKELLAEWNLKPKNLPVRIFVPFGFFEDYEKRGLPVDERFAIKVNELNAEDWIIIFNLEMTEPTAIVIERAITKLKEKGDFDISSIIKDIKSQDADEKTKESASALFEAAETWGVFAGKGEKGTEIGELIEAGRTSVLDLSMYSSVGAFNVRALVIGLITKKLFNEE